MANRLVFVSCGQLRSEERQLGQRIKTEIDATDGFKAYFADSVQSLSGLSEHIFDALRRCTAAVVVLHPRGQVLAEEGRDLGMRSSVWINQEMAVLAYRQFFERSRIPILAFKEESVTLEGAMTAFIVNPKPLVDEESIVLEVRSWLMAEASVGPGAEQDVFQRKWEALTLEDRAILAALIAEGGHGIKEVSIRRRLTEHHGIERSHASEVLRERQIALRAANLVQLQHNIYDGDEMSLHPVWEWHVRHAVAGL